MRARRLSLAALAALMLAAAATPAQAQQSVRVRAGEHADYTRLVLDAAPGAALEWGVADGALTVLMPQAGGFDTGPARAARGLSRVEAFETSLSTRGAVLTARLTCPCGARIQRLGDGRVVLDIRTGAPTPPAPQIERAQIEATQPSASPEQTAAAPAGNAPPLAPPPRRPAGRQAAESQTAQAAPRATEMTARENRAEPRATAAATPAPSAEIAPALPPVALSESVAQAEAMEEARPPENSESAPLKAEDVTSDMTPDTDAIEAARKQLLTQLTRAAEQGLLTLRDPAERREEAEAAEPGEVAADDPSQAPTTAPPQTQMRVRNAIDIAAEPTRRPRNTPDSRAPAHCAPDSAFDLERWASEAPFALQVGEGRRALIGEFDAPDAGAVLAYARLLIRFGFGVEARAALEAFSAHVAPPPQLLEMAALIDGTAPPSAGALAQGADCPGAHGLWGASALALGAALDAQAVDLDALRDAIAATPPNLRAAVALPIAAAALDQGALDLAEGVVGVVARSEPEPPEGDGMVTVLLARIDFARGEQRRAEAMLLPMIDRNTPAGVEAMIRLAEMRAARGVKPPPGLAENMEAVAFSQRDSALGRRLLAAAAQARAAGEGLKPALEALRHLSGRAGDAARAQTAARDMLVDYKPDPNEAGSYVETVLAHWDLIGEDVEGDRARIAVARNMAGLALGNLAEDLLSPALARGDPAARLAAAEAAMSVDAAERALDHVESMEGAEAARVRARAYAALYRYEEAVEAAAQSGDAALESRFAWLAGNWERAARSGAVDRRILAAWMSGEGDLPEDVRAAAQADPNLARQVEAFSSDATTAPGDTLQALADALEAARRRREMMGSMLGDG